MSRIVMECPSGHDSTFTHEERFSPNGIEVDHLFRCDTCGRVFVRTTVRQFVNPGGLETVTMMPISESWHEVGNLDWRESAIIIKVIND